MDPIDVIAAIGEVLSWIGFGIGIPVLLGAAIVRAVDGQWIPIEIAVVETGGERLARWFADDDFRERPLAPSEEHLVEGWHDGFVSSRRPAKARFADAPSGAGLASTAGRLLTAVGVLGFLASWLPALG